ncbi:MAG: DUF1924 domain-containing protein [Gammaproteobacteria bacterium]|nr:DUF1924 domain-containing protein [Gammaproteobacteria bacterium]
MKRISFLFSCLYLGATAVQAESVAVTRLLKTYKSQGATTASRDQGKIMWQKQYSGKSPFNTRSCASCHETDLKQSGKHVKTKKVIKPMAPSVNPERLTDIKEIEKWFRRNCKWTLGRECSPAEKASLLTYISQQ